MAKEVIAYSLQLSNGKRLLFSGFDRAERMKKSEKDDKATITPLGAIEADKTCSNCHAPMPPSRSDRVFCSVRCKVAAHRKK